MNPTPNSAAHNAPPQAALSGFGGLPHDRLARMAARRAFVEMKQCFMRAAADVHGPDGPWLQRHIRLAGEITELWRLRWVLIEALPADEPCSARHRAELQHHLNSAFPEAGEDTAFAAL
jgi:hypothetical protein